MNAKKRFNLSSEREISRLFKGMLKMLEDMKADHDFHYEKLYENIPKEHHNVLNSAEISLSDLRAKFFFAFIP